MTLNEALPIVHAWLKTRRTGDSCKWYPLTPDELAMRVLRKAFRELTPRGHLMMAHDILNALSEIPYDPGAAIILAAASWLRESQRP